MTCQEGGLKRESALSGLVQRWKNVACNQAPIRRGGRVAEGARLESVFTGNRNVGSNPTPSATFGYRYIQHRPAGARSACGIIIFSATTSNHVRWHPKSLGVHLGVLAAARGG